MTLMELSVEYRGAEALLLGRIRLLEKALGTAGDEGERQRLRDRLHTLNLMRRETQEMAVLMERYYERGYRRNGKYVL